MIYIVCVGNLKEKYLVDACNEYLKRLSRFDKVEINKHLKGYVIKLAIKGKMLSSEQLALKIEDIKANRNNDISFIIGSSHGIDESVKSDYDLSISNMTFPHQLTRVILLEQIYRSYSILNKTPYHK